MAWPAEAGALVGATRRRRRDRRRRGAGATTAPSVTRARFTTEARGLFRIANAPEYRFYRRQGEPPLETDTPYATASSLPATPAATFTEGEWCIAVSFFDGVLDSGFLPLDGVGRTCRVVRLNSAGQSQETLPPEPEDWTLSLQPNGVVRITARVLLDPADPPAAWVYAFGVDEPPTTEQELWTQVDIDGVGGVATLSVDLPPQPDGSVVHVGLGLLKTDGQELLFSPYTVRTIVADAAGPAVPTSANAWPGRTPEEEV